MTVRNLSWLRTELSRLLNFDEDNPDAAYLGPASNVWALIDGFAQEAYEAIVEDVVNDVGRPEHFRACVDVTWESSDVTYTLPSWLDYTSLVEVRDITHDTIGEPKWIRPLGASNTSEIWWKTPGVLQWGNNGPGFDSTLRIWYIQPEELDSELSEPTLLPHRFRMLWKWEAALLARRYKDEDTVPMHWAMQTKDWRRRFHHALMQGSPMGPAGATIDSHESTLLY